MSSAATPVKNIPVNAKAIPGLGENCSPSPRNHCSPSARNPVRLHPGTLFTFTPESFSPCPGIRNSPAAQSWTDYKFTTKLRSSDDDGIGVMFRYKDPNNYYKVDLDKQRNFMKLFSMVNGVETELKSIVGGYVQNADMTLQVTVQGCSISVELNGADLFGTVIDNSLPAGSIALYSWGEQNAYYDDVTVVKI
jgi:hypothetical protein